MVDIDELDGEGRLLAQFAGDLVEREVLADPDPTPRVLIRDQVAVGCRVGPVHAGAVDLRRLAAPPRGRWYWLGRLGFLEGVGRGDDCGRYGHCGVRRGGLRVGTLRQRRRAIGDGG